MSTDWKAAPFKLTIELEVWKWARRDAQEVAEQLTEAVAEMATTVGDGRSLYHSFLAAKLERVA